MIWVVWVGVLLCIAAFAWFAKGPKLATVAFIISAIPLFFGLQLATKDIYACDLTEQREIVSFVLDPNNERIFLFLLEGPELCTIPWSLVTEDKLGQDKFVGGKPGKLVIGGQPQEGGEGHSNDELGDSIGVIVPAPKLPEKVYK